MKNRMCTLALLALAPLAALQAQNPVPKLDLEKLPAEDPKNQLLDLGVKEFKINYGRRPALGDHKVAQWGPTSFDSPDYAIYARKVLPISGPPIHEGVVLVSKGKILAVGRRGEVDVPEGFEEVDAGDGWLMPGLVDLHAHIAGATWDLNDMVHQTNPEFRTLDLVGLHHPTIQRALLGGVTTILYIPGSGTNMGGFGTLTKTAGATAEEALVRFPGSLKIAQAGNPERRGGDMGFGRAGMNWGLRATLERGRKYYQEWEDYYAGKREKPEVDHSLEYLRGLFRCEYPVSVHTQIYQVCLQTLRQLSDEFGLWVFVDHGTFDAYRLSEEATKRGVPICLGPRQFQFDRVTGEMRGLASYWARGGFHGFDKPVVGVGEFGIGINTDSPVIPQEQVALQAAMAVRLGLPPRWALRGLTLNPARFIGIEHRVGSIEVGKDADLAVWTGDPLDPRRYPRKVMVNGRFYVDHDKNPEQRRF
jgi:imidazolonepropionase-like amidohydrolase